MKKYVNNIILLFIFLLFCYFFTLNYTKAETPLYHCDFGEYNLFFYDYSLLFKDNFSKFLSEMTNYVYSQGRHPFLVNFLIPFYYIFGATRFAYIFSVEIIFMFPLMILLFQFFYKYFSNPNNKKYLLYKPFIFTTIFFFPALWQPVLRGFPAICGMIPILISLFLYFKNDLSEKISVKYCLLLGSLLYFSFLLRRWYLIVIICLLFSILIENLINYFNICEFNKNFYKKIIITISNNLIIAFFIGLFSLIFQLNYMRLMLYQIWERNIYITDYSQWKIILYEHIGPIFFILTILGMYWGIKNHKIRFLAINVLLYFFIFIIVMKNQWLWIHHYLFPASLIIIIFLYSINHIIELIKNKTIINCLLCICIIYNCFNFSYFFSNFKPRFNIFSITDCYPLQNKDYFEVKTIYDYLYCEYLKNNNIKITLIGLNSSFGYYPLRSIDPKNNFITNTEIMDCFVDEDFFNSNFFTNPKGVDFVITISPFGFFSNEDKSQVLYYIQELFHNQKGIAKNYELVKEYNLTDEREAKLKIYKRTKKLSNQDFIDFMNLLKKDNETLNNNYKFQEIYNFYNSK